MDKKKKLTKEELDVVRNWLVDNVIRNSAIMFSDEVRGDENKISNEPDLIEVIVALYELLHIEVTGEDYDYMWHWANKVGSWVETNTDIFKEVET